MRKNGRGEKTVRCFELIDPHINVAANYRIDGEIDSDEEDDEEGTVIKNIRLYFVM